MINPKKFASILVEWSDSHNRDLPWKTDKNPYKIWLSEIILQQTRVQQGLPYYLHFVDTFPDVFALANATENQIIKSWEGLGYYSRARNLHKTAKKIVVDFNGIFPDNYDDLLKLPGIGPYSAAAIASFAYEQVTPVVDGNVLRFIARLLAVELPVDTKDGRKEIFDFVHKAIQFVIPSVFNQAIMDFGAIVCKPKLPLCIQCPFAKHCTSLKSNKVNLIPFKKLKIQKQERHMNFLDFKFNDKYSLICHQNTNDIWKGMYLLPTLEFTDNNINEAVNNFIYELYNDEIPFIIHKVNLKPLKQILTHRVVYARFFQIILKDKPKKIKENFNLVLRSEIQNFAMPKILTDYFQNNK